MRFYKTLADHKITISYGTHDDLDVLHRKILGYSANWRAREIFTESELFSELDESKKIEIISKLIHQVTTEFQQVLILDLENNGLDPDDRPISWLIPLLEALPAAGYPYLLIISNRTIHNTPHHNGISQHIGPISEDDSKLLFKILLKKNEIQIPSQKDRDAIENSIVGHPGLINLVVKHLKSNKSYRPNKTHNSILQVISVEVEKILLDFISRQRTAEKVIALFGEAAILSYSEIMSISSIWADFEETISHLIDAGLVLEINGNYQLPQYIQRFAQNLSIRKFEELSPARKILFDAIQNFEEEDYIPMQLLDARIVEHFVSGAPISAYMQCLVMPSQRLKAARREYDQRRYIQAQRLAKEAYEQKFKLSDVGILESWRLIGLSSTRLSDDNGLDFFCSELGNIPKGKRRESSYLFCLGLKERIRGNLSEAQKKFEEIRSKSLADHHVFRELAYIYAFDEEYDLANQCVKEAEKLAPTNPYIIDIEALILLQKYRASKRPSLIAEIENCLDRLEKADQRKGTQFYRIKKSMYEVFVNEHIDSIKPIYNDRSKLPIHTKLMLLMTLSLKGKINEYNTLSSEIDASLRSKKNYLAEIELARIKIDHLSHNSNAQEARAVYDRFRNKFTRNLATKLDHLITRSELQNKRGQ